MIDISRGTRSSSPECADELERAGIEVPPARPRRPTSLIARGFIEQRDFQPVGDEVRALAQHHGIPTALLDWSTHSLKAAYFAAAEAAKEPNDDKMVVWALNRRSIESRTAHQDFAIVTPPSWTNRNLFAQAGTFTHAVWDGLETVDDYLRRTVDIYPYVKEQVPFPWMRKLSAPRSCARKLLRLLASYGITGASLFPGHDGVVRAMRERALWDP